MHEDEHSILIYRKTQQTQQVQEKEVRQQFDGVDLADPNGGGQILADIIVRLEAIASRAVLIGARCRHAHIVLCTAILAACCEWYSRMTSTRYLILMGVMAAASAVVQTARVVVRRE